MAEERFLEWVEYTKINAEMTRSRERVVREIGLSIYVNKTHFTTVMMTPLMEKEFVVGHLFGQGIIEGAREIESITIQDNTAEVTLRRTAARRKNRPRIHSDLNVHMQNVIDGVNAILKSKIFAETEAVHSAGLFKSGIEAVCIAEDIGRHNALDKVIGYGLLNDIDFSNTFATSTGRQPSEMILRCCRANIPIIATKGVPTSLGIDIAEEAGITIIGLVRESGMTIYSNPARIR